MMRSTPFLALFVFVACAGSESSNADVTPPDAEAVVPGLPVDASIGGDASVGGYEWVRVPIPIRGTALFDVWGAAADDVWAVGAAGTILHWDGQQWQRSPTGLADSLNSVFGTSKSDVWVGASTHLMIHGTGWNADGGSWQLSPLLTPDVNPMIATIYGIGGTGPNDIWAVGDWTIVSDPSLGLVTIGAWHWRGERWTPVPVVNDFSRPGGDTHVALRSVWSASKGDVWVGGNFGRTYRNQRWDPLVPIERGSVTGMAALPPWEEYDSASRADVERTWGTSSEDVWAVGRNGVLRHWDGTSSFLWTTVDLNIDEDLHSVWGRAKDDVWAIGDNSTILHWDGTRWTKEPTEPLLRLYGIWGDAENTWIVGEGVILRRAKVTETGATQ